MDAWLSPSYKHDKLENPTLHDLIDVFEDLWIHYIFKPTEALLAMSHGDIASMSLLSSYFEAIESYRSGESSKGRSKEFFVKAFCRVYMSDQSGIEKAAEAIYEHIRCGLAHEGMLTYKVQYTRAIRRAFLLTYRKRPDGSLIIDAGIVSVVVNPVRMYEGVRNDFTKYVAMLREGTDSRLCKAFDTTATRQWALGMGGLIIGTSEEAFRDCH